MSYGALHHATHVSRTWSSAHCADTMQSCPYDCACWHPQAEDFDDGVLHQLTLKKSEEEAVGALRMLAADNGCGLAGIQHMAAYINHVIKNYHHLGGPHGAVGPGGAGASLPSGASLALPWPCCYCARVPASPGQCLISIGVLFVWTNTPTDVTKRVSYRTCPFCSLPLSALLLRGIPPPEPWAPPSQPARFRPRPRSHGARQ